jgi:hypothetical protein
MSFVRFLSQYSKKSKKAIGCQIKLKEPIKQPNIKVNTQNYEYGVVFRSSIYIAGLAFCYFIMRPADVVDGDEHEY